MPHTRIGSLSISHTHRPVYTHSNVDARLLLHCVSLPLCPSTHSNVLIRTQVRTAELTLTLLSLPVTPPLSRPAPSDQLTNKYTHTATLTHLLLRLLAPPPSPGTPLQNNMGELYGMLAFMYPDVFTTPGPFEATFNLVKGTVGGCCCLLGFTGGGGVRVGECFDEGVVGCDWLLRCTRRAAEAAAAAKTVVSWQHSAQLCSAQLRLVTVLCALAAVLLLPTKKKPTVSTPHNTTQVDQEALSAAHYLLRPFCLRRLKSEVEVTLPPKVETRIATPLSSQQIFWYRR